MAIKTHPTVKTSQVSNSRRSEKVGQGKVTFHRAGTGPDFSTQGQLIQGPPKRSGPVSRLIHRVGSFLMKSSNWSLKNLHLSSWWIGLSSARWTGLTYPSLAKLTLENPYGWRAMFLLSQLTSSLPINAQVEKDGEVELNEDHEFLVRLLRPNPQMGFQTFVIWLMYDIYFGGEVFFYFPETPLSGPGSGKPGERGLHLIRPYEITEIEWEDDGVTPLWYRWQPQNRRLRRRKIPAPRIVHVKWPNPFNPDRGLPMVIGAIRALDLMRSGDEWNKSVSDGKGRIPGYISWKPPQPGMTMDDDDWKEFKERSNEQWDKSQEGSKPFYLGGEFEFKEAGHSVKDSDWLGGAQMYSRQVALALGFDPALLGDGSNKTYSNLETALKAAFMLTLIPLWQWILDEVNARIMVRYDEETELAIMTDEVDALQEDLNKQAERNREDVKAGVMTIDEARSDRKLPARGGMADELTVLFNRVPLEAVQDAEPFTLAVDGSNQLRKMSPSQFEEFINKLLVTPEPLGDGQIGDPPEVK